MAKSPPAANAVGASQYALYSVWLRTGDYYSTLSALCNALAARKDTLTPVCIRLAAAVTSALIGVNLASVGVASTANDLATVLLFCPRGAKKLAVFELTLSTQAVSNRNYFAHTAF